VKKILILDDSNVVRQVIKIYLAGLEYELLEADNAERALQTCRSMSLDLVIADIKLPGMSGIEFVTALRAEASARLKALPVVLLTGEKTPELRSAGIQAGAADFVNKPVVGPELREAISRVFQRTAT
jgi:CheY-like chemotaxis protein